MGIWVVGSSTQLVGIIITLTIHLGPDHPTFMTGKRSSSGDALDDERATSPTKILRTDAVALDSKSAMDTAVAAAQIALREEIQLTEKEAKLFEFLLDVEKQYDCKAVLRVAGGWVRDKLLGRESDDVDIVIDTMTGKQFADLINAYEDDHGHKKHPVGIIKANPDQSKHLETATMQLGDIGWVDFVNLRAETYSDEHRIPEVEFGTPLQDAERRDFTINSLFYNVSERKIEDFTQRGVDDLRIGLIRTPLDPRVTFLDDPLRVLRAVRFASRFNFKLNEDLRAAATSEEVKDALIKKVSRERVGKELLGMLTGSSAHPERALKMLHDLGLCKSIFLPPLPQPIYDPAGQVVEDQGNFDNELWEQGYTYAAAMFNLVVERTGNASFDVGKLSEDEQNALKLRIFSAFLLPLAEHYLLIKKRQQTLPVYIIRESLKLRNRDAEDVGNVILVNVKALGKHLQPAATFDRVRVGLLLREVGALWELCSDVCLVKELVAATDDASQQEIRSRYSAFSAQVHASGLGGVWEMKPLLNGNELIKELGVKPGPAVKQTLERIIVWQLENPEATRDECLAFFRDSTITSA